MEYHKKYEALERMLTDAIKEEQIKLGYQEETIHFYYPLTSLLRLLGRGTYTDSGRQEERQSDEGWKDDLRDFKSYVKNRLGEIRIAGKNERICFTIPPAGVRYVKEKSDEDPFLREFIDVMRNGHCSLDDILAVFHKYSRHVACQKIEQGEFDYVIYFEDYFEDLSQDGYRYCIKFEGTHTTYHRFLPEDFEELSGL